MDVGHLDGRPLTNRLLLAGRRADPHAVHATARPPRRKATPVLDLIPVWDIGRGVVYHGQNGVFARPYVSTDSRNDQARACPASYVTGSHSIRVGTNLVFPYYEQLNRDNDHNLT